MRKVLTGVVVGALLVYGSAAFAKTQTITGKIVDEGCSLDASHGAGGTAAHGAGHDADHKMPAGTEHKMPAAGGHHAGEDMTECAIMCAKNGEPLALLTTDGKVFRITGGLAANKNAKLIAHVGHTVEITGDVSEKDGKVQIAADSLKMAK